MMKFAVLFALVAVAVADPIPRLDLLSSTGRIVGGVAANIEDAPYQVSLQVFGSHICGGVIISANHILTAAHCFVYSASWYAVRSGSTYTNTGGTVSANTGLIPHAGYTTNVWGVPIHDIGIINLSAPLTFSASQSPIALFASGRESVAGAAATITGWGHLVESGTAPLNLQSVTIPVISKAECSAVYRIFGGLPEGQICAGLAAGGQNSCQGDSGGPVTIDGALAGLVSWAVGCARPGYPGVYTEVAAYRDWITANSGV